jgi:hypothetical protein
VSNKPLTDLPVTREHHPHSITSVPGLYGTFGTYEEREHTRLIPGQVEAKWYAAEVSR